MWLGFSSCSPSCALTATGGIEGPGHSVPAEERGWPLRASRPGLILIRVVQPQAVPSHVDDTRTYIRNMQSGYGPG